MRMDLSIWRSATSAGSFQWTSVLSLLGVGRAADGTGGEDDREFLADLAVAGVEDHVLRVGVDAD